jgi:ABC-type dipeptide/oligopeptide/nickel transport system permease subunit
MIPVVDLPVPDGPTGDRADATLTEVAPSRSLASDAWRRFKKNKLAMFGLALVLFLLIVAIFGPMVFHQGPRSPYAREIPTKQHWFGTDQKGNDIFVQVVQGIRLSIFIGFAATLLQALIGVVVGAVSGWYGGWVDAVLMRIVDILLGIPYLLFAFALIAVLGRGILAMVLTIAITAWLQTARTVRAGFLQAKHLEYVEAARALGVGSFRIMWRHILPNVFQPVVVLIAVGIGSAILSEAALSFLGVGIQAPQVSLGLMVRDATSQGIADSPHMLIFPGLAIVMTVLGFLLVGDGLRDALDVKDV